jgi:hypothetical protein
MAIRSGGHLVALSQNTAQFSTLLSDTDMQENVDLTVLKSPRYYEEIS